MKPQTGLDKPRSGCSLWLYTIFVLICVKQSVQPDFNYQSSSFQTFLTPVPIHGKAPKIPKPIL